MDFRAGVVLGLSVLLISVVPSACSLDSEGSLYARGDQAGGSSTSSGEPGSTSSGSGSSGGSGGSTGTTGSTGSGGAGGSAGEGGGGAGGMGSGGAGGAGGSGGSVGFTCGNGKLDAGEECDDTNTVSGDGCDDCDVVCVMGGLEDPTTHHCYVLSDLSVGFDIAKFNCELIPDHYLASLTTQAEVDFVKDMSMVDIWIGGSKVNNAWTWVSNEPWTYVDKTPPWESGQPNNSDDCVELGSGSDAGTINDENCALNQPYLCEWNPPGTP